jgi:hypothetical protein
VFPGDSEQLGLASTLYTCFVEIHVSKLGGVIVYPDRGLSWVSSFS